MDGLSRLRRARTGAARPLCVRLLPPPSRAISNCAIAVPLGVVNGIFKFSVVAGSIRRPQFDAIRQRGTCKQCLPRMVHQYAEQ